MDLDSVIACLWLLAVVGVAIAHIEASSDAGFGSPCRLHWDSEDGFGR